MCIARSRWASDPGSCMPVSTRTMPSRAASAHALQCGTPGHGSGRRRRQIPGSTRSPRPSSRCLGGSRAGTIEVGSRAPMATPTTSETTAVARRYFDAVTARNPDAMADCWAPGAVDTLVGDQELVAPEGVRSYFSELFGAFPDFTFVVRSMITEGDRCAALWRATGTFAGPGSFQGVEPTGARIEMEGCDVVEVRDGRLHGNLAHINQLALARQIGLLPPARSGGERRLYAAFNQRTRAVRALAGRDEERVADGVWVVRGGMPGRWVNAFLIEDEGGVVGFDAGVRSMAPAIAAAAARHGGLRRVVLGNAHPDHRGGAPALRVPVLCHAEEHPDAEGDGGVHYFDYGKLPFPASRLTPTFLRSFDGGPVEIADTLAEGDEVAGF